VAGHVLPGCQTTQGREELQGAEVVNSRRMGMVTTLHGVSAHRHDGFGAEGLARKRFCLERDAVAIAARELEDRRMTLLHQAGQKTGWRHCQVGTGCLRQVDGVYHAGESTGAPEEGCSLRAPRWRLLRCDEEAALLESFGERRHATPRAVFERDFSFRSC